MAASRNDDHGGNLSERMGLFIHGLASQCRRHELDAELILVEWNPPEDRPSLEDALDWPTETTPLSIRVVTVPPDIHHQLDHSEDLPLFQMIAKNVGIRRADAPYVLATNIDILLNDDLGSFLASDGLQPDRMYRVDRYDVAQDVPVDAGLDTQLQYCRDNLLRVHRRGFTEDLRTGEVHRYYRRFSRAWFRDMVIGRLLPQVRKRLWLHLNACGDFTLMHRDRWHDVRGYPEFETYSFHLDALLCISAHCAGARETVLGESNQIYHIEHAEGSGWTPEGDEKLRRRLTEAGIPMVSRETFFEHAAKMARTEEPIIFNDRDWGMPDADLPETQVTVNVPKVER